MFNDNDVPLHLGVYGSSANTSGSIAANTAFMSSNSSGGLAINAYNASGVIKFGTGSSQTERLRIDSSGNLKVPAGAFDLRVGDDTDSNAGTQTISVGSVSSGSGGIGIFANPTNGNSFVQFGDGTSSADQYRGYMNYRHADDSLRFGTAGSDRLLINSSGYVTKPAHPSFCARHNNGNGFVNTDIICLTRMSGWHSWNSGHYSTSTGKFTAPVDGVYYFEAQAMTTGHGDGDNIQDMMTLESNRGRISYCRQRQTYFRTDENANGYFTNSVGGSIKLNATDTVWFQRKSGHSWGFSNQYYTYFTGWLIG